MSVQILQGDVRAMLATLAAESVQCVVTSPPYFQLRDYGVAGQIGLESTPAEFVATLVGVFEEVRRVLRPDGVCFVNIGDSYAGSGKGPSGHNGIGDQEQRQGFTGAPDNSKPNSGRLPAKTGEYKAPFRTGGGYVGHQQPSVAGIPAKNLLLIPQRFAIAMQDAGWYVRSQIAWCKTSAMPESVRDRPTSAWEPIWMFTKSARYFWDQEAVRQPLAEDSLRLSKSNSPRTDRNGFSAGIYHQTDSMLSSLSAVVPNPAGANLRNYWLLGPEPFSGAALTPGWLLVEQGQADYVGPDGKARKVSPDCPSHGLQHESRTLRTDGYGARSAALSPDSPDTSNHLDLAPFCVGASTPPDSLASASSSALSQTQRDTQESRPSGDELQPAESRSRPHSGRTSRTRDGTADSLLLDCSPTATPHSTADRRTVLAQLTTTPGNASVETDRSTGGTSTQLGLTDLAAHTPASSSEADSSSSGKATGRAAQTAPRSAGNDKKCSCSIITVDHYAAFPSEIPRRCILAASRPGDTVLDPFLGSGTTCLVADQLGRHGVGVELNPKYAEMARRRIFNDGPMFADVQVSA